MTLRHFDDRPYISACPIELSSRLHSFPWPFDLRDREQDRAIGVKSLVTYLSDRNTGRLFWFSWLIALALTGYLSQMDVSQSAILFQLIPLLLLAFLYRPARKQASDLLYYVVLDGLMALSAVLTLFARI